LRSFWRKYTLGLTTPGLRAVGEVRIAHVAEVAAAATSGTLHKLSTASARSVKRDLGDITHLSIGDNPIAHDSAGWIA
jgi:hypothetical protein